MNAKVQWTLPPPLQNTSSPADTAVLRTRFHEPFLLRFASDNFMDEFFQLAQKAPERLGEWEVTPETWRDPTATPLPVKEMPRLAQRLFRLRSSLADQATDLVPTGTLLPFAESPSEEPLKLYQPAHQRFYLVTAGLVCRLPSMPEKQLGTGGSERVSFVVRRLWPKANNPTPDVWDTATCDQYAYVPADGGFAWQPVADDVVLPIEERNPLFRTPYAKASQPRHLWAGLVPVGKRETYLGAIRSTPETDSPAIETDPRPDLLEMQVMSPWNAIVDYKTSRNSPGAEAKLKDGVPPSIEGDFPNSYVTGTYDPKTNDQIHMQSWYALLDMVDYLEKYLNDVWNLVEAGTPAANSDWPTNDPRHKLLVTLQTTTDGGANSLATVLQLVKPFSDNRSKLESATTLYHTIREVDGIIQKVDAAELAKWPDFVFDMTAIEGMRVTVRDQIIAALQVTDPPNRIPPRPFAAQQTARPINEPAWFVIRCVYERPLCDPIIIPPILSDASRPFQMASFFDPDAPARPIRIALPMDTSPAGLRKFDRNTAFMMSDALCGQVSKMRELTLGDLVRSVLPWPLHKDLELSDMGPCSDSNSNQFGMVCSLSIPIVTICALILLIMIVSLLDMIFRWMPYFIACFPLPFRARE